MQFKIAEFNAGSEEDHHPRKCIFTIFGTLMVLATASSLLAQNVASRLINLPLIADCTTALTNPGFSGIFRDDLRVKPSSDAESEKGVLFSRGLRFPQASRRNNTARAPWIMRRR